MVDGLKTKALLAWMSLVSAVSAQSGTTLGIVGITRISKPAMALNLVGNSFGDADTTLNEVAPISQFNGAASFSQADRVIVWNTVAKTYTTYALFDDSAYGGTTKVWRAASAFYGSSVNPIIPAGSAFWMQSSGSSMDSDLFLSGNVVDSQSVTNQIFAGLQLLSYPFSSDIDLNATMLANNATGAASFSQADRVIAWNVAGQTYATYALFDDSAYGGTTREWRSAGSFYNPAGAIAVNLGQGFWYEAKSGFSWVETNPYFNNL